ncbi:MAG: hypothetical protein AAFN30_08110, partial [Actinomycetota bacterium]
MASAIATATAAATTRRARRVGLLAVVALVGLVTVVVGPAHPAAAHTDLLQASPGPGQRAGGDVRFIDLVFTEPVTEATVTVTSGGVEVPSRLPMPPAETVLPR